MRIIYGYQNDFIALEFSLIFIILSIILSIFKSISTIVQ
jgi:hypothetical protein